MYVIMTRSGKGSMGGIPQPYVILDTFELKQAKEYCKQLQNRPNAGIFWPVKVQRATISGDPNE